MRKRISNTTFLTIYDLNGIKMALSFSGPKNTKYLFPS